MTWFKVDDRFPESDKVIELVLRPEGLAALGVWTLCGAWAAGRGNGGRVTEAVVKRFRGTRKHVAALVAVGLWDASDDEWKFHDWGDYNESAEAAEAVKVAEREAGRRGNHERWHVKRRIVVAGCEFCIGYPTANSDSSPDRVPDTDPDSRAIPPGPGPVPDPEKTDVTTPDPVPHEIPARDGWTDEEISAAAKSAHVRDLDHVIQTVQRVTGPIAHVAMLFDLIRAVERLSLKPIKSADAYLDTVCLNSPDEIEREWRVVCDDWNAAASAIKAVAS